MEIRLLEDVADEVGGDEATPTSDHQHATCIVILQINKYPTVLNIQKKCKEIFHTQDPIPLFQNGGGGGGGLNVHRYDRHVEY